MNLTAITRLAAALFTLALMTPRVDAALITYTETVTGSGTLGSSSFTNALVTFTETANTTAIVNYGNVQSVIQSLTAAVNVAGVGTGLFTIPVSLGVVKTTGEYALFQGGTSGGGTTILDQPTTGLLGYDLSTAIGPVTGSGNVAYNPTITFATTLGALDLTSVQGNTIFQASLGVVPEPSSLFLCGLAGVVGLSLVRVRRQIRLDGTGSAV